MGGVDLWQNDCEHDDDFTRQSVHDKMLEVVCVSGLTSFQPTLLFGSNPFRFKVIPYPDTSPQPGETKAFGFNWAFALINTDNEDRSTVISRILYTILFIGNIIARF